jgi:hypothetical protein
MRRGQDESNQVWQIYWILTEAQELIHMEDCCDWFDIFDTKSKISDLQIKIATNQPLVQIGMDIRRRFLYQEGRRLNCPKASNYQDIMTAGNVAAHHRHVTADLALLNDLNSPCNAFDNAYFKCYYQRPADVYGTSRMVTERLDEDAREVDLLISNASGLPRPVEDRARLLLIRLRDIECIDDRRLTDVESNELRFFCNNFVLSRKGSKH